MKTYECDVVVVGAGPGGSMAAKFCAEGGLDTILIEKKAEVGAPLRCAEGVSKKWLEEVGIEPDPLWIRADMIGAVIKSPDGTQFKLDESKAGTEVGYVLERHLFDKALARDAVAAGSKLMMRTSCTGIIREDGRIAGIRIKSMGEEAEIRAKAVVAADGYESQVGRWAGIDTKLKLNDLNSCIQYRMVNCDADMEYCEFIIGRSIAPGGYLWIFPKGGGVANVGIGVMGPLCKGGEPREYLDRFLATDPRFKDSQPVEVAAGFVSTCPGLDCAVDDNLILVGDAARVIDPLTGGGICHACRTGMYAGKVLVAAAAEGDFSKAALMPYEKMWRDRMEDKLYRNWMAKERLAELDDETINELVRLISTSDIEEVNVHNLLRTVKERFPKVVEGFEHLI
jgi:digeranylgeranylglycerophospholipid reductase